MMYVFELISWGPESGRVDDFHSVDSLLFSLPHSSGVSGYRGTMTMGYHWVDCIISSKETQNSSNV